MCTEPRGPDGICGGLLVVEGVLFCAALLVRPAWDLFRNKLHADGLAAMD